ncbi:OadG family transporter subunit [Paraclostridium bifermentans]|jgi:Na+-transporting methylmalonyl-CoA/oxaloacetate decarboxylase gamma subunit|uniref:OadG family transporter subunit n=1 Tax=Paraclostridium bifermentans TaxID=1490 RepID=UPI0029152064|nr:OadG family transporter subunit [Paraclostridium bifermentans]MDU3335117.1 OadG family transporter subunit [Paraclostridium bifermentans]
MNISQLLEALKDPSASISIGEKLLAGVCVAILSMAVVFIVLVIISLIIKILQVDRTEKQKNVANVEPIQEASIENKSSNENIEELVSVITASIAAATGNSTNNIIVRKIQRTNNNKSSWERMPKNITK